MKQRFMAISFITMIIGFAAAVMIFLPALGFEDSDTVYSGWQATFGYEIIDFGIWGSGQLEFNFLAVLAFGLPLVAGITALLFKQGALVSTGLFIVSAILLFMLPEHTIATATVLGSTSQVDVDWVMQYGLITAGVLSIAGAFTSLFQGVTSFREQN